MTVMKRTAHGQRNENETVALDVRLDEILNKLHGFQRRILDDS